MSPKYTLKSVDGQWCIYAENGDFVAEFERGDDAEAYVVWRNTATEAHVQEHFHELFKEACQAFGADPSAWHWRQLKIAMYLHQRVFFKLDPSLLHSLLSKEPGHWKDILCSHFAMDVAT